MEGTLYRVATHYFVAGVVVDDRGRITTAAPILKWARGRSLAALTRWVESKGGEVSLIQ